MVGDSVLNGNKPLDIGQGVFCDVQIPESDLYEPHLFATIVPIKNDSDNKTKSSEGWYVVKRTDCHRLSVNGIDIDIAQVLKNGDVISFFDTGINNISSLAELKFEVFDDGEFEAKRGIVFKKHNDQRTYYLTTAVMALLAIGIAAYALLVLQRKDLHHEDLSKVNSAIYHITTDSVYLIQNIFEDGLYKQIVTDSIELGMAAEGTAFLTSDSLFVTARHCIEPWIADEEWDGVSTGAKMLPEVRLATIAETGNRMAGYEKYTLRSHCIISKGFERYSYYSTDFCMNKSRDMVIRLVSAKEILYWRSIIPIATRRDMELGDFAYLKAQNLDNDPDESYKIPMAKWEEIVAFSKSYNHDIAVIGYPLNDNNSNVATAVYGNLMELEYNETTTKALGCLQLSAPINPGNSGGPVIAKINDDIKVIGIVSKADTRAQQGMFWAVPITEVGDMHLNGDSIAKDTLTFRR
ncbi:MAG: serine protease [Bacteroidales bacterium]|nr:serine protease [Bacteroidales bacterium]